MLLMKKVNLWLLSFAIFTAACEQSDAPKNVETLIIPSAIDHHTQAINPYISFEHLHLDVGVDFTHKKIAGKAVWIVDNKQNEELLYLDTDDLTIDSVIVNQQSVQYVLDNPKPHLGSRLSIPITPGKQTISIYYHTGSHPHALQWLSAQQTGGKNHPFLYTQSESIYARSWIPCPDGPGVRFTYTARVKVPTDLMAVMSATNPQQKNDSGIYHFKMEIPIPAYLMALAVGDLEFKAINKQSGVYAESYILEKAVNEFSEIGTMIAKAERLYGPYQWGRYDILVLPPGFPIGGMENPRLTFATPTIIAGDKSLVNLIAHELAHSWSGNLVTNATWNDFWLNEGFTVYFERRLTESMTDKSYADMLWELGYQDLEKTVNELGSDSKDTHLKLDLSGRDPDEGLNDIAYEKGALFLRLIEQHTGRERFDRFLTQYFKEHAFKTIYTEAFIEYLQKNLLNEFPGAMDSINIQAWVYGPGIPSNAPRADKERFNKVQASLESFLKGTSPQNLETQQWTSHEWLYFIRMLPKPMPLSQMEALDEAFHFTHTGNSEIACAWFITSIAANYTPAYKELEKFVSTVGRRKFIEPIYTEMMQTGKTQMAQNLYKKYRNNYHPLAQNTIDKIVGYK